MICYNNSDGGNSDMEKMYLVKLLGHSKYNCYVGTHHGNLSNWPEVCARRFTLQDLEQPIIKKFLSDKEYVLEEYMPGKVHSRYDESRVVTSFYRN